METKTTDHLRALEQNARLRALLQGAFDYIVHSEANRGKLSNADQWEEHIKEYLDRLPSEIGVGRMYVSTATVKLVEIRKVLAEPVDADDFPTTALLARSYIAISSYLGTTSKLTNEVITASGEQAKQNLSVAQRAQIIERLSSLIGELASTIS